MSVVYAINDITHDFFYQYATTWVYSTMKVIRFLPTAPRGVFAMTDISNVSHNCVLLMGQLVMHLVILTITHLI